MFGGKRNQLNTDMNRFNERVFHDIKTLFKNVNLS